MVAALYRRYRPESFAEMIGQSQVTDPLRTALRTGRIGHAYLFSGPRGCGKTTSARILARCLNCAEGPTDTPCGTCPSCVELSRAGGGSLDVVEIDAASHGGVDDARDLRERAVFAPARDRFKIFIIDEAHMVTAGGFNALLKIVEEPPPHVKFVFATTEPDKVIGTIRSRTHHYPFRLIAPGPLIDYAQSLCESEGVTVEPGVLPLVARAGGGSVRDTLSILDQLIAGSEGNTVTADRAAGLLGFTHTELIDDVVTALAAPDPAAAFRATDRVIQTGQDPRRFTEDLLERLRDLIVVSATTVDGAAAVFRGVPQDQLSRMFEQSQAFARGELSRIADTVSVGLDGMAGVTAPRLQLELMIARALLQIDREPSAAAPAVAAAGSSQQQSQVPQQQSPQSQPTRQPQGQVPQQPVSPQPERQVPQPQAMSQPQSQQPAQQAPAQQAPQPQAPQPQAPPPQQAPAGGPPMNAAQTAASIRDFLREEDAGAATVNTGADDPHPNTGAAAFGRPISDVLSSEQIAGMGRDDSFRAPSETLTQARTQTPESVPHSEAVPSSATSQTAVPGQAPGHEVQSGSDGATNGASAVSGTGGFDDLVELWPELLEEILQVDRDAWNAVRVVQPIALEDDVLTIGLASDSDLATFKSVGAGPLRETISAAIGLTVKYIPRRISPTSSPRGQAGEPRAPQGDADAEEPHRAGPPAATGQAPENDPVRRADERLSALGLGPALAAPAWADPEPTNEPTPATEPHTTTNVTSMTAAATTSTAATAVTASPSDSAEVTSAIAAEPAGGAQTVGELGNASVEHDTVEPDSVVSTHIESEHVEPTYLAPEYVEPTDDGEPYGSGGDPYNDGGLYGDGDPSENDLVERGPYASSRSENEPTAGDPTPGSTFSQSQDQERPDPSPENSAPNSATPNSSPDRSAPQRTAPELVRYGEAVVREVLGARFIEERPLPPAQEV